MWMPRSRSIRTKLTFWYAGVLALSLILFGGLFYLSTALVLSREMDRSLRHQSEGVAQALLAFREAEQAAGEYTPGNWQRAPSGSLGGLAGRGLFPQLVKRWAEKTSALQGDRMIRFLDSAGRTIAASWAFLQEGLSKEEGQRAKSRKDRSAYFDHYQTVKQSSQQFRLINHPLIERGRILCFVQVGASTAPLRTSLARLRLFLMGLTPLVLLVASVGGWILASRALEPVSRMIAQVEQIGAGALEKRVDVPDTGDELERLARTFDHMLDRVERAFRQLRQFSAAASHELRTPLTVMKGELEVTLRRPRALEEYQRLLAVQLEAINELINLVEELLTLSRSEAVGEAIERRPVDLGDLTRQVGAKWRDIADKKGVHFRIPVEKPVWVRGERRLLERLLANLLDNAIRMTPAQGLVTLWADEWRGKAQWIVQDTGPGIPAEEMSRIFDRFFSSPTAAQGSTSNGLGLALCRWIAEVHHGRIQVSSLPGQGATFTVWLPLIPAGQMTSL